MKSASRSFRNKIKSPQKLAVALRRKRKKIVFTNGCFDIVHAGHVSYLEKAKKLGDILVVALNTDQSVKKLKGQSRPVNALKDRLDVLAAFESVDFVTWFKEDTPLELIKMLRPQVLVKGGDWKPSQIVGSQEVKSWGGRARSLNFVQGKSTTRIIKKIFS